MQRTCIMKKTIIITICLAVSLILLTSCATAEDLSPEIDKMPIDWIDLGSDFKSVRFETTGENLYIIEATASDQSRKYGLIDGGGGVVFPVVYDAMGGFHEGLCYVELDNRKFFMDTSGKEVIDVSEYTSANSFEFGVASVTRERSSKTDTGFIHTYMQGLIDQSGNEILPCEYTQVGCFENGLLWAEIDSMYIIFDNVGNRINEILYSYVSDAGEGMIIVEKDNKSGYLDKSGKVAIPLQYEEAYGFFDGVAIVADNAKRFYVNNKGKRLTSLEFDSVGDFSGGFGVVMDGEKYGYIDSQGELAIPCDFDEAYGFKDGVAIVMKALETAPFYYTIDKSGKLAIKPEEQGYYKWKDSYVAYFNPEEGDIDADFTRIALLDNSGIRISDFYSDIGAFSKKLAVAEYYEDSSIPQYGVINQNGVEIVPLVFDKLEIVDSNTCIVQVPASSSEEDSRVGILTLPKNSANKKST